jgi:hypothetical protein
MSAFYRDLLSYIDHMGTGEWLFVATLGVAIGLLCMRGLGSRSCY